LAINFDTNVIQFLNGQSGGTGLGVGAKLKFPSDLDTSNYYMMFQFVQYERPDIFKRGFNRATDGISLPLPTKLIDHQTIAYDRGPQNPAVGAAIESAISGGKSATNSATAVLSSLATGALGAGAGLAVMAAQNVASGAGTSLNNVLSLSGVAVNPFLTVLFNSPTFKQHTFSWKFTPKNLDETNAVKNITNAFKYHALPDTTAAVAGTLLSYPDMVYISISPANDYMYKFKPCVIEAVEVDYAGEGSPAFFGDSKGPASVVMSISLLEIEYHLKSDWQVNGDGTVKQIDRN